MKKQDFSNHTRFWYPHHFIFYPVILVALIFGIRNAITDEEHSSIWIAFSIVIFLIGWLSFMTRQHYGLMNQNRIVRLEMRLRYFQLSKERFEPIEKQLSFSQLAALRFAADGELIQLVKRTLNEHLSPTDIKKSIVNWEPDYMRV